jgi:hypothetical protein
MFTDKTKEQLEEEIRKAQAQIAAIDEHNARIGQESWAVEEYHRMTCTSNHTDYCGWTYENENGATHQRYKKKYRMIKENYEHEIGDNVDHDDFVRILNIIFDAKDKRLAP